MRVTSAVTAGLATHGVGNRHDLPLPFGLVVAGACAVLIASFVGLSVWRDAPRSPEDAGRPLPRAVGRLLDGRVLRGVVAALGALLAVVTLAALLAGSDDTDNPAPYVVFVWLWIGLPFLSLLLGPVWRVVDPVRWVHRALARVLRVDPARGMVRAGGRGGVPASVGYRPAALGLLVFGWLELVQPDRTTRPVLTAYVVGYLVVTLVAAVWFGDTWFRRGDPFGVASELYGALAVPGRRGDGTWVASGPAAGLGRVPAGRGLLATASVMLAITAYDGFQGNLWWTVLVQTSSVPLLWQAVGLLGFVGLVAGTIAGAAAVSARLAGRPVRGVPTAFAPSIVPIAAGYVVAHYWSLFVVGGQVTWLLLSDPLGTGADLLHSGGQQPSDLLIQPTLTAVIQVVAIVTGHVLGLLVAHDVALRLFPRRVAVLGQVPVLVVMVGYTIGGLVLLFSA